MIEVTHPNGYRGVLQNGVLTVYYGEEEIMRLKREKTLKKEIYRQLEYMPRFVEMVRVVSE